MTIASGETAAAKPNCAPPNTADPVPAEAVGLNPSDANVMKYIDGHPGATPSEVAHATGLQRSNMSTALKNLESRGFVERRTDPSDGRGVNLYPTARAAKNLSLVRREWAQHMALALGDDRENVTQATALLRRLEAGLVAARQR